MTSGNGAILFDAAGNPVALSPGAVVPAAQPALVAAGSDYATSPKAQIPKVDGFGTLSVALANSAGAPTQVFTGQPSLAASSQYGSLAMGRMDAPAPSVFAPLTLDGINSLNVHLKSKPTFRGIAPTITCAANKCLLALTNTSASVVRLQELNIYIPPSGASGNLLGLGASITYYPVICEIRRIASFAGGTAVSLAASDSVDTLQNGISAAASPTTVGASLGVWHRQDAFTTTISGISYYARNDPNQKTLILRSGESLGVFCVSSGVVNNANGSATVQAQADLVVVITTAAA